MNKTLCIPLSIPIITAALLVAVISPHAHSELNGELEVNGYGIYEEFGAALYALKLNTLSQSDTAAELLENNQVKILSLKVIANSLGQRQWCRFWTQNIAINISSADLERLADSLLDMCDQTATDLAHGDHIEFRRLTYRTTEFRVNGAEVSLLEGEGIFEAFLSPFVDRSPVSSELKLGLLSNSSEESIAASVYSTTLISDSRLNLAQIWAPEPELEPVIQPAEVLLDSGQIFSDVALPRSLEHPLAKISQSSNAPPTQAWSPNLDNNQPMRYETASLVRPEFLASYAFMPSSVSEAHRSKDGGSRIFKTPRVSLVEIQEYQNISLQKVYENIIYPSMSLRRNHQGSLRLMVQIDKEGGIQKIDSLEFTDYDRLNEAAEEAVAMAAPFAPPPLEFGEEFFDLLLPIT